MKKLIGVVGVVAALALTQGAFAAEKSGVVKNWFEAKAEIVLADGTECKLGKDVKNPDGFGIGKEVTLTFATENGANTCSAVAVKK